jgi:predicted dehydrogenase
MTDEQKKHHRIGIIMNGVTGRMGSNQHLMRSIVAIREQGGVPTNSGERIMPDPILVGRNPEKLKKLVDMSGIEVWTTDVKETFSDPNFPIYFDAQVTELRAPAVQLAIEAGKHVYCEKPVASTLEEAYSLYKSAQKAGVKHGVVMDKLWLPGFLKLRGLIDGDFFGEILAIRGNFGYWVFEGDRQIPQRPSWNYRKEDGGGIILDMFPHWSYILENLFGRITAVSCLGATHIKKRWDEQDESYTCTADDAAYAIFKLGPGVIAQFNSSWVTRVRRDDLVTIQVDGTEGSAVVGLRKCYVQSYNNTPKPVWNPDVDSPIDFYDSWEEISSQDHYDNAFKQQWELFLKHVVAEEPYSMDLLAGSRGVLLAEKGIESWERESWVSVPEPED